jgi:hypothetical protein
MATAAFASGEALNRTIRLVNPETSTSIITSFQAGLLTPCLVQRIPNRGSKTLSADGFSWYVNWPTIGGPTDILRKSAPICFSASSASNRASLLAISEFRLAHVMGF